MNQTIGRRPTRKMTIIKPVEEMVRHIIIQQVKNAMNKRLLLILGVLLLFAPYHSWAETSQTATPEEIVVIGRIIKKTKTSAANKKTGDEITIAIKLDNGQEFQLENDEAARLFYLDPAMLGKKARLRLQTRADKATSTTINVEIEHEGRWRVPQYYCDVCTIAVRYPQICLCCQGPMEFRLKPER